jgi:hypothetical protein
LALEFLSQEVEEVVEEESAVSGRKGEKEKGKDGEPGRTTGTRMNKMPMETRKGKREGE